MAAAGYFDRTNSSNARPSISQLAAVTGSPKTPQRTISSAFSSPGASYRAEEEYVVFEVGARHIRAGFAGDSRPRCAMTFGKEESRRVGDYRSWLSGYDVGASGKLRPKVSLWGADHELWRLDLRELEIGLFEDKFERAVREAYGTYLLLDSKSRKVLLAIPSVLPHALLASMLSIFFNNSQAPAIMLLPTPHLAILAAGQRSGVVVDIGWHETVITAVYEFREVKQMRTVRAMRSTVVEMGKLMNRMITKLPEAVPQQSADKKPEDTRMEVDFDPGEDITIRLAWCNPGMKTASSTSEISTLQNSLGAMSVEESAGQKADQKNDLDGEDSLITLPVSADSSDVIEIPFSSFKAPVESALFALPQSARELDDEEQAIHNLLYSMLVALPADVRSLCMANIVITGGGSNIPGVKSRILHELSSLVQSRGWDPVWGKSADKQRRTAAKLKRDRHVAASTPGSAAKATQNSELDDGDEAPSVEAAFAPQESDIIEQRMSQKLANESTKSVIPGTIRSLETLGTWAGGSLAACTRVKAVVEIERESFLQHGMAGARRESELSTLKSRQSMGAGIPRAPGHDSGAWTLSAWA